MGKIESATGTITGDAKGKVVKVISDLNAAIVAVKLTDTYIDNYGIEHSTSRNGYIAAKVLTRGSSGVKDYFNYSVGDVVYILYTGENWKDNDFQNFRTEAAEYSNYSALEGYIAGTFYAFGNNPPAYYEGVRIIDFGGGNFIEVNLINGDLFINFKGAVYINGQAIYLNG